MKTSLEHLPEYKQANIHTIVDIIRDEFEQVRGFAGNQKKHCRIVMIILFGSYAKGTYVDDPANGYISDYDILVLLNRSELVDEYKIWSAANDRILQRIKAPVSILVHTHSEVNERLSEGHFFFRDIRSEGIELYNYGHAVLVEPGNLEPKGAQAIAQKHFEQWFVSAGEFLDTSGYDFGKNRLNKAAFELHQAAERYYTCILLVFTNYRPKSHNIENLNNLSIQQAESIKEAFPLNNKFNRRCFQLLKGAYIDACYSEHYKITEEELNWLAERVKHLQTVTETLCKKKIASFTC